MGSVLHPAWADFRSRGDTDLWFATPSGGGSPQALAGTSAGTSTSTGDLAVAHPLAGTSAGTSTTTGAVVVTCALAGTSAGTGTTSGDLTIQGQVALAGASVGSSATNGGLGVARALAGVSAGVSVTRGILAGSGFAFARDTYAAAGGFVRVSDDGERFTRQAADGPDFVRFSRS